MALLNAKTSLLAGIVAGVGASVCCVGPLALLGLGVGGAWIGNLSAFEPYRPAFLVLTVVFVGLAFRSLYLVPQACAPGANCADPRSQKRQRALFWWVTTLLLGLLAVPLLAPLFY